MADKRSIAYLTGTRADFGLMRSTLEQIAASDALALSLLVTGMHLDRAYGHTLDEVVATGLPIAARIDIEAGLPSGQLMARNIGQIVAGLVPALDALAPDIVLLLGDRGEMLAGAIAALHLNIPIAHIHGGERSGTVDESIRHAISKLAHIHLVATEESRERLVRMGELADHIHCVGAPGLDGLVEAAAWSRPALFAEYGLDPTRPLALVLFHAVVQEADSAADAMNAIVSALAATDLQVLALHPNSDAGGGAIAQVLQKASDGGRLTFVTHLARDRFVSFMSHADIMVGNSSSGIIEAASFGLPVVNVGSRQNFRQRNGNVVDVAPEVAEISGAIAAARAAPRLAGNVYGDGRAGARIVKVLEDVALTPGLMAKVNAY